MGVTTCVAHLVLVDANSRLRCWFWLWWRGSGGGVSRGSLLRHTGLVDWMSSCTSGAFVLKSACGPILTSLV